MPQTINKKSAARVLAQIYGQAWAISKEGLATIITIAERQGSIEALMAKRGEHLNDTRQTTVHGNVAVIPVRGPIIRYSNIFSDISGAASAQAIAEDLQTALDNPEISAIVMDYDSPGGQVAGINELANTIYAAATNKKVVSYCSGTTASAAYWLASAGSEVVCDATCQLGSIGTVIGFRKAEDDTIEIVSSQSPNKRVDPSTEKGRTQVLAVADAITDVFIRSVARFRAVDKKKVESDFGQGGVLVGENAVSAGLADRLGSLDELVTSLQENINTQERGIIMTKEKNGGAAAQSLTITIDTIKQDCPDIAAALRQEGSKAELERVRAVSALKFPGHESAIAEMAMDGKTTAEAAALKLVTMEQDKREAVKAQRDKDGKTMPKITQDNGDDTAAEEEAALIAAAAEAATAA